MRRTTLLLSFCLVFVFILWGFFPSFFFIYLKVAASLSTRNGINEGSHRSRAC